MIDQILANLPTGVVAETHPTHVRFKFEGIMRADEYLDHIASFLNLCREANVKKILIDARHLQGDLSLVDQHRIAERWYKLWDKTIRVAIVSNPKLMHPKRFFRLVIRALGMDLMIFTEESPAQKWLVAQRF